jgi:hypothetical protein
MRLSAMIMQGRNLSRARRDQQGDAVVRPPTGAQ